MRVEFTLDPYLQPIGLWWPRNLCVQDREPRRLTIEVLEEVAETSREHNLCLKGSWYPIPHETGDSHTIACMTTKGSFPARRVWLECLRGS